MSLAVNRATMYLGACSPVRLIGFQVSSAAS
jgi:hypothetical protein